MKRNVTFLGKCAQTFKILEDMNPSMISSKGGRDGLKMLQYSSKHYKEVG